MNADSAPIPPDDLHRSLSIARPEDDTALPHLGVVGDNYTILLTGAQTAGRYCLIEMRVPPGGGPPPHRHDFEEMFTVLEGEIEVTFRGQKAPLRTGQSANIPANAPHHFQNVSSAPARLLCLCAPAGQEDFFLQIGIPLPSRLTPAPLLDAAGAAEFKAKAEKIVGQYRTEFLPPPE